MPEIGELVKGKQIGKKGKSKNFIWHACIGCGKERWVEIIKGKPTHYYCSPCAYNLERGSGNRCWKGGRVKAGDGSYIAVKLQPNDFFYLMANTNGYVLEHRLIVAKALCRCLLPWEIVHHRSGFAKDDNRYPETLQLLPHIKYHIIDTQVKRYIKKLESRVKQLEVRVTLLETENTLLKSHDPGIRIWEEESIRVTTK